MIGHLQVATTTTTIAFNPFNLTAATTNSVVPAPIRGDVTEDGEIIGDNAQRLLKYYTDKYVACPRTEGPGLLVTKKAAPRGAMFSGILFIRSAVYSDSV